MLANGPVVTKSTPKSRWREMLSPPTREERPGGGPLVGDAFAVITQPVGVAQRLFAQVDEALVSWLGGATSYGLRAFVGVKSSKRNLAEKVSSTRVCGGKRCSHLTGLT